MGAREERGAGLTGRRAMAFIPTESQDGHGEEEGLRIFENSQGKHKEIARED